MTREYWASGCTADTWVTTDCTGTVSSTLTLYSELLNTGAAGLNTEKTTVHVEFRDGVERSCTTRLKTSTSRGHRVALTD